METFSRVSENNSLMLFSNAYCYFQRIPASVSLNSEASLKTTAYSHFQRAHKDISANLRQNPDLDIMTTAVFPTLEIVADILRSTLQLLGKPKTLFLLICQSANLLWLIVCILVLTTMWCRTPTAVSWPPNVLYSALQYSTN